MQHQYPFTCLVISTDRHAVDVNVHPTKMEVRFSDEKKVYDAVRKAVSSTLSNLDMILHPEILERISKEDPGETKKEKGTRPPEPFETRAAKPGKDQHRAEEAERRPDPFAAHEGESDRYPRVLREDGLCGEMQPSIPPHLSDSIETRKEAVPPPPEAEKTDDSARIKGLPGGKYEQMSFIPAFCDEDAAPFRRFVGQVFNTYWIVEYGEEMYLFDQHAAHERILYERFMRAYEERTITSEYLTPPMIVTLDAKEVGLFEGNQAAFSSLGFEIEPFGERDFAVRAVPSFLGTMG